MDTQAQVQQVSVNPIAVISAVITALGAMTITAANKSNLILNNVGDVGVFGTSALARVTKAVDERAEIYGTAIVANGSLAEREHAVKGRMRLRALERQEAEEKKSSRKPTVSKAQRKPGRPAGKQSKNTASRTPKIVNK
jgi:Mg-chelatase subunit ChlI